MLQWSNTVIILCKRLDRYRRLSLLTLCILTAIPVCSDNFLGRLGQRFLNGIKSDSPGTIIQDIDIDSLRNSHYEELKTINSRLAEEHAKRDSFLLAKADSMQRENIRMAISFARGPFLADSIVRTARQYIGTPYRYGATGPSRFDCSGFTGYVYRQFGINLPRTSSAQRKEGDKVAGDSIRRGDLVIFGSRRNTRTPGHVGIVVDFFPETGTFTFIHASTHGGVMIDSIDETYYRRRFIEARRILY